MRKEAEQKLDKLFDALTDPETGVYNRLTRIEMRLTTQEKILRVVAILTVATAITVFTNSHLVGLVKVIGGLLR